MSSSTPATSPAASRPTTSSTSRSTWNAESFSIELFGDYFDNPGGIVPRMEVVLSNLSWGSVLGSIDSVTPVSTDFGATVSNTADSITVEIAQFSTSFGGPEEFTNSYQIVVNHAPEPASLALLAFGIAGLGAAGGRRRAQEQRPARSAV
jgi:hypothetical protein